MRSIREIENLPRLGKAGLSGKKVVVRVDFNVPIKDGKVEDDFRIRAALPTINFLLEKGARLVLITHLGKDGSASLEPVINKFFEISKIDQSHVTFFENVRKFPGEETNDEAFVKELAALGEVYVNEAFSVSHRKHASVVGVPKHLPSYAGLELQNEIENLSKAFQNPEHPFLFILGGAKFETKLPLIEKYLDLADSVFIGGALANDFLKAQGCEVGQSLVSENNFGIEKIISHEKIILPTDVVTESGQNKSISEINKDDTVLDIGKETIQNLGGVIKNAKFILWNGPLGKYEDKNGGEGTRAVLKLVAASSAESIVGGGDTVALVTEMQMEKDFSFISTGGGATLEFLATGTLPGIQALKI
jgi:phosphoglycerate kinase